jgi:hypothetical protein
LNQNPVSIQYKIRTFRSPLKGAFNFLIDLELQQKPRKQKRKKKKLSSCSSWIRSTDAAAKQPRLARESDGDMNGIK